MFRQRYLVRETSFPPDYWRIGQAILLAASFLLLLAFVPSSHAQARCRPWSGGVYYSMSGSFISGFQPLYRNSSCSPPSVGTISFGSHGAVDAFNRQSAIDKCNSHNSGSNYSVSAYGSLWSCNPGDDDEDSDTSVSGGGGSGGSDVLRTGAPRSTSLNWPLGSVMVNAELGTEQRDPIPAHGSLWRRHPIGSRNGSTGCGRCLGPRQPVFRSLLPTGRQSRLPGRSDIAAYRRELSLTSSEMAIAAPR